MGSRSKARTKDPKDVRFTLPGRALDTKGVKYHWDRKRKTFIVGERVSFTDALEDIVRERQNKVIKDRKRIRNRRRRGKHTIAHVAPEAK